VSVPSPQVPEYGDNGDFIGARRMRRAFRWAVALVVAFTILLWIVEQFWRYPQEERLYLSALTLLPEQGRNFLREAVKVDEAGSSPSSRYLEALAEREQSDLVISAYERAHKLDSENADLKIKFGCELIKAGQYVAARELFREAAEGGAHNGLAVYLEAAVLPLIDKTDPDYDGAITIIAQGNASGDRVTFPRPMWFPTLKRDGYWYANLRRQMVQHCGAPIETLTERMLEATERDLNENHVDQAIARLQALEGMGRRIATGAAELETTRDGLAGGLPQVYLGLRTVALAVDARDRILRVTGASPDEELVRLGVRMETALREIDEFEQSRRMIIEDEEAKYQFPLLLIRNGLASLFICFLLAYALSKIIGGGGPAHNVRHSRLALIALLSCSTIIFLLLLVIAMVQRASLGNMPAANTFSALWWLSIAAGVLFGIVAPSLTLPSVATVLQRLPAELRTDAKPIQRKYRAAYLSLVKRYLGIQLGLAICAAGAWVILYRVSTSTYPWMSRLLATGMESKEVELIRSILSGLV